jgi:hypothetical protein
VSLNFKLAVQQPQDDSWWDLTPDLVGRIRYAYGNRASGILDRTGTAGSIDFSLDNDIANGQHQDWFGFQTSDAGYPSRAGGGPYTPNLLFSDSDAKGFDLFGYQVNDSDTLIVGDYWFQVGNRVRYFEYEDRAASTKDGAYVGTSHAYTNANLALRSGVKVAAGQHINLFSSDMASDFSGSTGTIHANFVVPSIAATASARYLFNIQADANNYVAAYLDSDGKLHCEHRGGGTLAAVTPGTTSDLTTDDFQITMTWDTLDGLTAWINGRLLGSAAIGAFAGAPIRFVVGAADTDGTTALDSDYCFGVTLWPSVVERTDLLPHLNERNCWYPDALMSQSSSDCIGHWPMNEGSGATAADWSETPLYFKFVGRIKSIEPDVGRFSNNEVAVVAMDWFDDAAVFKVTNIPTQVGVKLDEALFNVVSYSPSQPQGVVLSPGADTFPFTTYDTRRGVTVLSEIAKLTASEMGYAYMRGTVNSEGVPGMAMACEGRHDRLTNTTAAFSLTDDATSDVVRILEMSQVLEDLKNSVDVTTHPADVDTDNVVVTSLPTGTILSVAPTGTFIYTAKYLDSDNAFRVVGVQSIVAPVRNTDFIINTSPTGSGTDLTNDYKATLASISPSNLLAYYPLNDLAGDVFRNEVDNTGTKNGSRNSNKSNNATATTTGSGGGSGGTGTNTKPPSLSGGGCFAGWTCVDTPNGLVPIDRFVPGDLITTNGRAARVLELSSTMRDDLVRLETDHSHIVCSPNHRFATPDGWQEAAKLKPGDVLRAGQRVTGVSPHPGMLTVFNLHIDDPAHEYMVVGHIVHNVKTATSGN